MKKWIILVFSALMIFSLTACSAQINETKQNGKVDNQSEEITNKTNENISMDKKIRVVGENGEVIVFSLNNSQASQDLYNQLPLKVEVENFSNNEKIFYPSNKLSVENTSNPSIVGVGTLAYYRPWGNVVMFYDSLVPNSDLYELGSAISGETLIKNLSGTVTIEKEDNNE